VQVITIYFVVLFEGINWHQIYIAVFYFSLLNSGKIFGVKMFKEMSLEFNKR